jgi:hypothetical protein
VQTDWLDFDFTVDPLEHVFDFPYPPNGHAL